MRCSGDAIVDGAEVEIERSLDDRSLLSSFRDLCALGLVSITCSGHSL